MANCTLTPTLAACLATPVETLSGSSVAIGCVLAVLGGSFATCGNMLLKYTQLKVCAVRGGPF